MTGGGRPESKVPSFDRSVDQKGLGREPRSQQLKGHQRKQTGRVFHGCAHPKAKIGPNCGSNAFWDGTEMLVSRRWRTLIRRQRYRGSDQM